MDKRIKYFWQGEPVKTEFGIVYMKRDDERFMSWYNYECHIDISNGNLQPLGTGTGAIIEAIRVTTKRGESFVIANHFGIGAYKLKQGGWPNCTHFSLPKDKFEEDQKHYSIRNFNPDGYANHESEREKWFKKHYSHTDEYKKIQALREMIRNRRRK